MSESAAVASRHRRCDRTRIATRPGSLSVRSCISARARSMSACRSPRTVSVACISTRVAVVPRHVNRPDDVLDDDDERLVGGDRDRLRELARVDDVGTDVARRRRAGQPKPFPSRCESAFAWVLLQASVFSAGARRPAPTSFKAICKYSRTAGSRLSCVREGARTARRSGGFDQTEAARPSRRPAAAAIPAARARIGEACRRQSG